MLNENRTSQRGVHGKRVVLSQTVRRVVVGSVVLSKFRRTFVGVVGTGRRIVGVPRVPRHGDDRHAFLCQVVDMGVDRAPHRRVEGRRVREHFPSSSQFWRRGRQLSGFKNVIFPNEKKRLFYTVTVSVSVSVVIRVSRSDPKLNSPSEKTRLVFMRRTTERTSRIASLRMH